MVNSLNLCKAFLVLSYRSHIHTYVHTALQGTVFFPSYIHIASTVIRCNLGFSMPRDTLECRVKEPGIKP